MEFSHHNTPMGYKAVPTPILGTSRLTRRHRRSTLIGIYRLRTSPIISRRGFCGIPHDHEICKKKTDGARKICKFGAPIHHRDTNMGMSLLKTAQTQILYHLIQKNFRLSGLQCFTVYNLQFTVYNLQFTIYSLQFTVYNLKFTIYGLKFAV
jgi:hypothetical protein